jgi:hypothetical protein
MAYESDFQITAAGLENVGGKIFLGCHSHAADEKNTTKE